MSLKNWLRSKPCPWTKLQQLPRKMPGNFFPCRSHLPNRTREANAHREPCVSDRKQSRDPKVDCVVVQRENNDRQFYQKGEKDLFNFREVGGFLMFSGTSFSFAFLSCPYDHFMCPNES